ncbi:hypothetical protein KKQ10_27120 [Pseudomonas sp. MG-9]|uniref:hypothetical protein n=1 Tax=unclassified Pseudomonas TaxID=196821 RepID=UPI00155F5886|nr:MULTISPECIES: hypothetical protein [unclassified Pseudomonas]MBT9268554.1 hypothetical protein [Pseudomonas sp. MG-9]
MQTSTDRATAFTAAASYISERTRKPLIPASWMPVYVEPITHSGERITVAVAITTGIPGDVPRVVNTLDVDSLKTVFGKFGDHLYAIADSVSTDLQAWLSLGGELEGWQPAFSGVFPGRITGTRNVSIEAIIGSAKTHTSLFSAKTNDSSQEDSSERSLNRFQAEIRKLVEASREGYSKRFNCPLNLYGSKGRAVISYVGTNLAINFSTIDPSQKNSSYQCATAQRKINQLLRLRDINIGHDHDDLLLGIWVPKKDLNPGQEDQLDSYTSELEYAAKKAEIDFEVVYGNGDLRQVALPFAQRILADA